MVETVVVNGLSETLIFIINPLIFINTMNDKNHIYDASCIKPML